MSHVLNAYLQNQMLMLFMHDLNVFVSLCSIYGNFLFKEKFYKRKGFPLHMLNVMRWIKKVKIEQCVEVEQV